MGGNHFDAEEAISLAALKAWAKLPKHASSITNLKGWLTRLTHNLCVDLHRQHQRHALSTDAIEDTQHSLQEICNASVSTPETRLLQQERNIYLRYCIEQLPSRLRNPLILRYYHEMSCAEIGQKLSITQNTVSKRLQEARDLLKDCFQQYSSGLNKIVIDEVRSQELEQKNFQAPIKIEPKIEEISYTVTISCLETLLPVWCDSLQTIDWI
ncbi:rna sigma-24 ecf subfamily [Leptolyngbya sp. Heron Island J]|nr:rna sigma-24 ecf subfamily [Leptolyngbya sp. Heron Island J]